MAVKTKNSFCKMILSKSWEGTESCNFIDFGGKKVI